MGFIAHFHELTDDTVAEAEQAGAFLAVEVFALYGVLQPSLGFGCLAFGLVELVDKHGFVLAPTPGLRDGGGDGPRRTPNLVGERIHLLLRPTLRRAKD